MTLPFTPRLCPRTRSPLSLCSSQWSISSGALWHTVTGAGMFVQLRLEGILRQSWEIWQPLEQTCLCSSLGASQWACTPHEPSPNFPLPSASPSSPATIQGGSPSPCRTPGLECLICCAHSSLLKAIVPFPLSPISGAQVPTQLLFFASYVM